MNQNAILFFKIFIIVGLTVSINFFSSQYKMPKIKSHMQDEAITLAAVPLKIFSLGLKRFIGDLYWMKTLLDSDLEHYHGQDFGNWMYLRFNLISELDPLFIENYRWGGKYLMIIKDDIPSAEKIFSKGLRQYPTDYDLCFDMGFLKLFGQNSKSESLKYFNCIKDHPKKPSFFDTFFTKLLNEEVGLKESLDYALSIYQGMDREKRKFSRLHELIYNLKSQIDLDCLNKQKNNCSYTDFEGFGYEYKNGMWTSIKNYKIAPHLKLINEGQ